MSPDTGCEVTERDVIAVVKRHVPPLACERVRFLSLSSLSTWEVDDSFIVRFAIDDESEKQLTIEAAALPVLALHLSVDVPQVEFVATAETGRLVMGYPKLRGVDGENFRPPPGRRGDLVPQFAEMLLEAQAIPPELFDPPIPPWSRPDLDTRLDRIAKYAPLIVERAPELMVTDAAAYLNGGVELPAAHTERVMAHTDIKGEHLLFDVNSGRLTSVLDWADISYTDPAVDLGALAIWLGPQFVAEVAGAMGASAETLERALFMVRSGMLIGFGATLAGEKHWPEQLALTQLRWAFAPHPD